MYGSSCNSKYNVKTNFIESSHITCTGRFGHNYQCPRLAGGIQNLKNHN